MFTPSHLWAFLPWGYLATVLIETPVLVLGLSPRHGFWQRIVAGLWLTACTYPIVVLVLPLVMPQGEKYSPEHFTFLAVAETFAPVAECLIFWLAFIQPREEIDLGATVRDMIVITAANLASFLIGMWVAPTVAPGG